MYKQAAMKKQIDWNDIPSLEGIEVDWDYKPSTTQGKASWPLGAKRQAPTTASTGGPHE